MLNTPMAVLAALFVVVAVNGFLIFAYHSPNTVTPSSSTSSSPPEHTLPTKLEATTSSNAEETTPSRTKSPSFDHS